MEDEEKSKKGSLTSTFPKIEPKSQFSSYSYLKSVHAAPYRALVGVVLNGKEMHMPPPSLRHRVRNITGITNRWRPPQSLYGDLLGASQAMRAVNVPFDLALVQSFDKVYPSMNTRLNMCEDFPVIYEHNWSLLKKGQPPKPAVDEDENESIFTQM